MTECLLTKNTKTTFNYYFLTWADHKDQPFFSLDPKESDLANNQKILNALIGTLVKYDNGGKIEPYLAEEMDVSSDKHKWAFKLRSGLLCEDGTKISAPAFKKVLERQLLEYSKKGSVLEFEKLVGWADFLKGKDLEGIGAPMEDLLVLNFDKEPVLLLELLRMPYFGFWCSGNFENDRFKADFSVISSGPYRIANPSDGKKLELVVRNNWFSVNSFSPHNIIFHSVDRSEISGQEKHSLIDLGVNSPSEQEQEKFHMIFGVPTLLTNLVLNPYSGFFANINNRRLLSAKIFSDDFLPKSKNRVRSRFFFNHQQNKMEPAATEKNEYVASNEKIKIAISTQLSEDDLKPLREAIVKALNSSEVEFIKPDKSEKGWREKLLSNRYYDARIASVDAGGSFSNLAVKMIFCSQLGVRYPDASGRICQLVSEYEQNNKEIDREYVGKFNKILSEDASVIPVYYGSVAWIVSNDIVLDSLPTSVIYFQYEKLKLQ